MLRVMAAPIIPALTDGEIERIIEAAAEAGARTAVYVLLRLPHEVKELFAEWLGVHAANKAKRVMSLVRQTHGGRDYDATWGRRMTGAGPYAEMIARCFRLACQRLGLDKRDWKLDSSLFRLPPRPGHQRTPLQSARGGFVLCSPWPWPPALPRLRRLRAARAAGARRR